MSKELSELGTRRAVYRIVYEGLNRSGLRGLLQPWRDCRITPEENYLGREGIDLAGFQGKRLPFFVAGAPGLTAALQLILNSERRRRVLEEAETARAGRIRCFSAWQGDYGQPVDWHLNPRRKVSWPRDVHWSQAMAFEPQGGDCKLVWEINRFPHLYTWVRAYVLTGDSRWVRAFCDQLQSWEEANPYRAGINWSNGQELAIRVMAWVPALYVFCDDDAFGEEDFRRLLRLLYLHGEHLLANLNFARLAVPNNHLVGEALGLYLLGSYFPWMRQATKWKKVGWQLLAGECLQQFYADGGYCQSSHNYHRLALHYYLWACRIGECLGEPFPPKVYQVLAKSAAYLASFMNLEDGRLPNWGANDGALLCPWTACDYSDFRPVLNSLRYLTTGKRAFGPGPWDEELLWLWGPHALQAEVESYPLPRQAGYQQAGLYVRREGPGDFVVFRCGSLRHRFGQADQLHVDLWWHGLNIAQDGGSYLYNDEPDYHRHFMGTGSHNTVRVDGQDQMRLVRRFTWLEPVRAGRVVLDLRQAPDIWQVAGEHYGYRRLKGGIVHRRRLVVVGGGTILVIDNLYAPHKGTRERGRRANHKPPETLKHRYELRWLLGDWPWREREAPASSCLERVVELATPAGSYLVLVGAFRWAGRQGDRGAEPIRLAGEFSVVRGREPAPTNEDEPRGWVSRYYGVRSPAPSLVLAVTAQAPVIFVTLFSPAEESCRISLEGGNVCLLAPGGLVKVPLWEDGAAPSGRE